MKYMIIGAGGTGGILGFKMAKAGMDVTLIARGAHLEAIQTNGLKVQQMWNHREETVNIKATSMEEYDETPDVILVCVKGYSLDSVYPFIRSVSTPKTIVIPILNIYGTGGQMQKELPHLLVTDGCIYVSANISQPGILSQHGEICRVVFGVRDSGDYRPELETITEELEACGIRTILSDNIQRDALQKFSYVSPAGAVGLYYDCPAREIQKEGAPREMFKAMVREIIALAQAMDIHFDRDLVQVNLNILDALLPEATTSMQRDIMDGKDSEVDGLVYQIVRLGQQYKVPVPEYEKAAARLQGI